MKILQNILFNLILINDLINYILTLNSTIGWEYDFDIFGVGDYGNVEDPADNDLLDDDTKIINGKVIFIDKNKDEFNNKLQYWQKDALIKNLICTIILLGLLSTLIPVIFDYCIVIFKRILRKKMYRIYANKLWENPCIESYDADYIKYVDETITEQVPSKEDIIEITKILDYIYDTKR